MNREPKECDRYKQAFKEVQRIVSNIIKDKEFVGEGKLWQTVFDIEKIISEIENDR